MEPVKVPFGKHFPDQPALNNPGTPYLKNVIPANGFLRPFAGLSVYSDAIGARVRGAISGRDTSGNVYTFAGDATSLNKLTGDSFADMTRVSGGAYATPVTGGWEFLQWSDNLLIAINGEDAPQKINPQNGSNFEALGGAPPAARHGAVVGNFVVLGNWAAHENVVAWSALDNAEEYNTNGANQSDQQFIASGGAIRRILGGEVGIIFCQSSIHRMTYLGSPVIFQIDEIGPNVGLLAPGAAAIFGKLIFFAGQNSIYKMTTDGEPIPIGESRFNKQFFSEIDENNLDKISSAIDPINTIWAVAYPTTGSVNGLPNRMFLYNWATDDCSFVTIDTEYILGSYTPGITLDDLSSETGYTLEDLPFSLDSRVWQGGALILAGIDRAHRLGFFSGPNLAAEIETGERDLSGGRIYTNGVRPLIDAADVEVAMKVREFQSAPQALTAYTPVGADGRCPQHIEGRFMAARMRIPAGSSWRKAQGVEVMASPAGEI